MKERIIKPCPFCGATTELELITHEGGSGRLCYVRCNVCGGTGPLAYDSENAIGGWNTPERAEGSNEGH